MALTNAQYESIIREYEEKLNTSRHALEKRKQEIYGSIPEYAALENSAAELSVEYTRKIIDGVPGARQQLSAAISEISQKKKALLQAHRYPSDYLEQTYECPDCKDTGYIGSVKCHCFEQASISLLYEQSGIRDRLERENFNTFDINRYSDAPNPLLGGMSNRAHMQRLKLIYEKYAYQFKDGNPSLLIFGNPGVGKTFLCNCIAKVVLDKGFSVLYMTAPEFFESAMQRFHSNNDDSSENDSYALTCSLLIIDDLGTENLTPFVISQLFHVINSRDLSRKTTIISTNLSPEELQSTYTERISSRLMGQYTPIPVFGEDLRNS